MYVYVYGTNDNFTSHIREGEGADISMPSVTKVTVPKPPSDIDARWSSLEAMEPAAWGAVAARVSVCVSCLGPALLSDEQLGQVIALPRCRGCSAVQAAEVGA